MDPTAGPTATPAPTPGIDLGAHSVDDPASIWVVVNKLRTLAPVDYIPADLVFPDVPFVNRQPMRQATADALVPLFARRTVRRVSRSRCRVPTAPTRLR
ncbi:hypothetical protein ACH61_03239 [Rathayibacter tanaceti]|uniref:Uncharacterized protein n=1 Tax=Rathayibacter tanaceti TaxID=1671680 RepID=A0A162IYL8_9MICO|nr:hypothetical protein ACH61_03239 [Rathayibacter tanaceti]